MSNKRSVVWFVCLLASIVLGGNAIASAATQPWTVSGKCVLANKVDGTMKCNFPTPDTSLLDVAETGATSIAQSEYIRTLDCGGRGCPRTFRGPWYIHINTAASSVAIQITAIPHEGQWVSAAEFSGPYGSVCAQTEPPPSSNIASLQWMADLAGFCPIMQSGLIGSSANNYFVTTSGEANGQRTSTVTVSRAP